MNLNKQQIEAIHHINGPLLVLAGAGSGKTKVVTSRIAYLLEIGIDPSTILALTFTNKAADEMKNRIKNSIDVNMFISTFHSLGVRILRESIHHLDYTNDFTIYDSEDSLKLLKACLVELNLKDNKEYSAKKINQQISRAKNNCLLPASFESEDIIFANIYNLYQNKLKNCNALDFDDLLFLVIDLFNKKELIKKKYQKKWQFLLIDEYQDTNTSQYLIAQMLAAEHKNIFVVGDPDQSIYGWRGAKYTNILNFDKDFSGAKTICLNQNYRSTNNILNASNYLIQNNKDRLKKELFSNLGDGEKVNLSYVEDEETEATLVIENLMHIKKQENLLFNDIVVFYRTNAQSRKLEEKFLLHQIPYKIYGGTSFYQRMEIKDILSFLKIVQAENDLIAFSRSINLPRRGIGKIFLNNLLSISQQKNISILKCIREILDGSIEIRINKTQKEGLSNYLKLITKLKKLSQTHLLSDIIFEIIEEIKYFDYLKQNYFEYLDEKKQNVEELINKATEWDSQISIKDNTDKITVFLEEISLYSNLETINQDSVKLMTLHNGKGLEFELVFICGIEEDLLPHVNSKNENTIDEERRLLYVGMTRAKRHLFLYSCLQRYLWGYKRKMVQSRFLSELPEKFLNLPKNQTNIELYENNKNDLEINNHINHHVFGNGVIKNNFL